MNEQKFWDLVAEIGWGTKTTNYKEVRQNLLNRLSVEEMKTVNELAHQFQVKLQSVSDLDYCCDTWDDCTAHIVGLGKEEYEKNIADPSLIMDRYNDGDYVESFSYCLPVSLDYEKLSYYTEWINHIILIYAQAKQNFDPQLCDKVLSAMKLLRNGRNEEFLATEQEVVDAVEKIASDYYEKLRRLSRFAVVDGGSVGNKWGVLNLFTDVKEYNPQ